MDAGKGGRETSTGQIAAHLAQSGHQVTLLCQAARWACEGVEVRELNRRGRGRVQRMRNFITDVEAEIAREPFDIVHSMLPIPSANVYQPRGGTIPGQVAGARRRWGLLGWIRVNISERLNHMRNYLADLERTLLADPSVLCLAVSQLVADEFREHFGRTENVRVVYNAVDAPVVSDEERARWRQEQRDRLHAAEDDTLFLIVAKNFPLKGVAETIRAFARWHHARGGRPRGQLVVVGRDVVEGYERIASLNEVGRAVTFVAPTDEVFRWYAACDVNVLLSWYDPCSRVVLEATRWGVPSVTTQYNGAAEILLEGAGLVVDSPRNVPAVAAAMEQLSDPRRRAEAAEACRRVSGRLDMRRHVQELLREYERRIGGGGA